MWINPNHPDPPRRPEPPADNGRRLAAFPRGQGSELRVCLSEYQGNPYISLRICEQDRSSGAWWPTRKGTSIRISEAGELAAVLAAVAGVRDGPATSATVAEVDRRVGGGRPGSERTSQPRMPRRGPSAPRGPASAPAITSAAASQPGRADGFDEFNGDGA